MNKRLLFGLIIFFTLLLQVPAFAGVRQTEVRVKPGEKSIKVNMHLIPSKKAFYKSGALMVPLRIFADSIGANLENSPGGKAVIVFRNNKNIKFVMGKNFVYIDGVKKETSCAPVFEGGSIMVPLRALADGFNAVILKDSYTNEVVIKFPFQNYQNRFAYIKEGIIGDSYYGWSVLFPKGCVIDDKKPSGSSILVKNIPKGYYYYIFNTTARHGMQEKDLLEELKSYIYDEKVIQENVSEDKSAHLVLESQDEIYEYKALLSNGRLYQIHFYTVDKQGFLDDKQGKIYHDIINSFNVDYSGDLAEVIDINEISNGMYTYRENSFGWEIDLPAQMNRDVKKSDFSFEASDENGRENGLTVGVNIYPINNDETLEEYSKQQIDNIYKNINKECISELITKNTVIDKKTAKKIYYKINIEDKSIYFFNAIIFDKQSKFYIFVYGESKLFKDEKIDLGDRIIQSFLLPENPVFTGLAKKSEKQVENDLISYENGSGWKLKYPATWIKNKTDLGILIQNSSGMAEFQIIKKDLNYSNDTIKEEYGGLNDFNIIKEEPINVNGFPRNMISFECNINDVKYFYSFFIFKINGKSFLAGYRVAEAAKSEENLKMLNNMLLSLEISF